MFCKKTNGMVDKNESNFENNLKDFAKNLKSDNYNDSYANNCLE